MIQELAETKETVDDLNVTVVYDREWICLSTVDQWRTEGPCGVQNPLPEIPKALQNRAKLNAIVKTVKNSWI